MARRVGAQAKELGGAPAATVGTLQIILLDDRRSNGEGLENLSQTIGRRPPKLLTGNCECLRYDPIYEDLVFGRTSRFANVSSSTDAKSI